ncbi:transporter [Nitrincola sp. A-D6]|uniref:MFS transporter n=1 Tax=Nitrincola sp. A-D6 TaxID=1545442 RepID=UPI00051FA27C|nr:MFS transporter [Nitrincola sp. A-D6]KGK40934.1 transporter [Nitrincola sp. A-D6]
MSLSQRPASWVMIFLPFALGYYLSYLLRTVNAVISPELTQDLSLSAADLGLLTSAYFLTFGMAQIPLGIALDRYGPKRVLGSLLLLAAVGSAAFAMGDSLGQLTLARGLIGLGVSACLMAGLKGFAMWYPAERQSSMTGYIMAAGALGALTASTPMEAMLPFLGWRGVFWLIAGLATALSVFVFFALPGDVQQTSRESLGTTLKSVAKIFIAPDFLRFAGSATFFTGGFMAMQSLWAVPWLMNVNGLPLNQAASYLMILNLGMLTGQLSVGLFGTRLSQRGVTPLNVMQIGYGLMLIVQGLILTGWGPILVFWFLLGVLSAANAQTYIATAANFPKSAFGRVSTAINLMAFAGAFIVQWGLGIALDLLQQNGASVPGSLRMAFAGLIVLQILSFVPLMMKTGKKIKPE